MTATELALRRLDELRAALPATIITLRRNRRTLLSLRGSTSSSRMTIHPVLLSNPDWSVPIIDWVRRRGRGGAGSQLRAALRAAQQELASVLVATVSTGVADEPVLGGPPDLRGILQLIHARWFADLPIPAIGWARHRRGRISGIRFGCYRRQPAPGRISINPRLARPWTATCFLEHVIHHELCHHRQAHQPTLRRERIHSPRFRAWEGGYPLLPRALAWEHSALPWLLDDQPPPWHRGASCQPLEPT